MICPECRENNDEQAVECFHCGRQLASGIRRGSILGSRYEILGRLGSGGMGTVYKAHDQVLDETVAVKVLRQEIANSADMERRFRSEVKLARRVRHPHVCGIHEYGEDGGLRYLSMELIEGTDLKQVLRQCGRLPTEEAYDVSIQLAEGLQAIHDVGIIHRDLKTANVMRDARGQVRLMDFGIAKQLGSDASTTATVAGHILGTPEYMSPEQALSEPLDARSDIYALGIVIYEIFTGHVPFHGDTPVATLFKHIQDPPPLQPADAAGIPAQLVPVLKRALAKPRAERQATAKEVADDLRRARGLDLSAAPPAQERVVATTVLVPRAATAGPRPRPRPARPATSAPRVGVVAGVAIVGALLLVVGGVVAVSALLSTGPAPASTSPGGELTPATRIEMAVPTASPVAASVPPTTAVAPGPAAGTDAAVSGPHEPAPRGAVARSDRDSPKPDPVRSSPGPASPLAPAAAEPSPAPQSARAVRAAPLTEATGVLQVVARPWAEVSVDGRNLGTTPFKPVSLAVGVHTVVFSHPDYKPFQRKVVVRPDEVTRLEVDLSFEAFRR